MTRALIAAFALTGTALIAIVPVMAQGQSSDPRLVVRAYDANRIVEVRGKTNVQATIRFGDNEKIENVAIGDSMKWQVTPNKRANLLFVKPLAARATTNMTVVTSKRTYLFDLTASPNYQNPLYVLSFRYPKEEAAAAVEAELAAAKAREPASQSANALELAAANDPFAVLDPAQLNFLWSTKGSAPLLPERVYDNGNATFLAWPADTPLPAILVRDDEGTEGPVNFAVRDDVIVMSGVPDEIILRSGDDVATLTNEGPARPAKPNSSTLAQVGSNGTDASNSGANAKGMK